jgi:hypothetical protein
MGKGIVRTVNNPAGGSTGIGITVSSTGATGSSSQPITNPPGQVLSGTITDSTGNPVNFSQSFGAELGIQVNSKVNFTTVTVAGQVIANSVKLVHRGEVLTVNATNDGGTIQDIATGGPIPFAQVYVAESGITQGTKVNYLKIIDPNSGNVTAVALEVV